MTGKSKGLVVAPNEVFMDERLSKIQIRVLLCIISFRDHKTTKPLCPKRETILARLGGSYCPTVLSRATRGLEKLGWLTKIGKGGFSKSTTYEYHVPDHLLTVTESVTVSPDKTVSEKLKVLTTAALLNDRHHYK